MTEFPSYKRSLSELVDERGHSGSGAVPLIFKRSSF